jgi:hypothetical protein
MGAFDRFVSSRAGAWSKDLWDGLIAAIDARFAPLEEQLDIQKETTDKIVGRGLQIIEDELTPALNSASDIVDQIEATQTSAEATAAAIEAILTTLTEEGVPAASVITTALLRFVSDAEMAAKAPLASPTFTGTPAAPTAAGGTNTTQIATTAFVKAAIDALISSAPGTLDTLDELAAALGDDANFASTVTTALANRLRFDAAQTLSGGEKAQALTNIGLSTALKSDATAAISAGFTLTPYSDGTKSSGTFTPDPANHNYRYVINNGAHTIAAPTSDCAMDILYRNAASAGALTMSGFRVGAVSGDVYATAERASIAATFTNGSTSVGITAHGAVVGDMLWLTTTGALPTNFATGTNYYVASVVDANTVTLAATPGGAAISAGSAGSGTHTAKLASQFILMIRRINGLATYAWKALQ